MLVERFPFNNALMVVVLLVPVFTVALLGVAGFLHLLPKLEGRWGPLTEACCRAPVLDALVCYFTILPLVGGAVLGGWAGFFAGIVSQVAALLIWQTVHEALNPAAARGPRIIKVMNRKFGAWRNLTAVYVTALAVPVFWLVRMAEILVYPPLVWLIHLPPYKTGDWVNVSRQKFSGLVGHDLIWCLYCDWMTGVWSLGTEMLRNVESFWCPIRFACDKKCENCAIDFPDVNNGWVRADGTMQEVADTMEKMYTDRQTPQGWFGHPVRKKSAAPTATE